MQAAAAGKWGASVDVCESLCMFCCDGSQERERFAVASIAEARRQMEATQEENAMLAEEIAQLQASLEEVRCWRGASDCLIVL